MQILSGETVLVRDDERVRPSRIFTVCTRSAFLSKALSFVMRLFKQFSYLMLQLLKKLIQVLLPKLALRARLPGRRKFYEVYFIQGEEDLFLYNQY